MSRTNISVPLEFTGIEKIIMSMPINMKIKLLQKLEQDTWAQRLDTVVGRIRKQIQKSGISDKEITQICRETRKKSRNE